MRLIDQSHLKGIPVYKCSHCGFTGVWTGRRSGEPTTDEMAGAADILYALMSRDGIKTLARHLRRSDRVVWEALCRAIHEVEQRVNP